MKGFSKAGLKGYRPYKAAQAAAYFVEKQGGSIEKLKLIKLMYLGERFSLSERARPMFYDEMYSLPHGPICSNVLNGINEESDRAAWSRFLKLHGNRTVKSIREFRSESLNELSDSDCSILGRVWEKFGHMSSTQIRQWTHDNCPEYTEVGSGRVPILYRDVFSAVGYENAADLEDAVRKYRLLESALEF